MQVMSHESICLARICRSGPALPRYVPPVRFRWLRVLSCYRPELVQPCEQLPNQVHKALDQDGLHQCWALTDIFGLSTRRILGGLAAG